MRTLPVSVLGGRIGTTCGVVKVRRRQTRVRPGTDSSASGNELEYVRGRTRVLWAAYSSAPPGHTDAPAAHSGLTTDCSGVDVQKNLPSRPVYFKVGTARAGKGLSLHLHGTEYAHVVEGAVVFVA